MGQVRKLGFSEIRLVDVAGATCSVNCPHIAIGHQSVQGAGRSLTSKTEVFIMGYVFNVGVFGGYTDLS